MRYKHIHLFDRSTGSIIGAKTLKSKKYDFDNVVFISPAGLTFRVMDNELRCRVYYDPNDRHLLIIPYQEVLEKQNVERREYPGANHNFEYDNDLQKTIEVTGEVVQDMIEYLVDEDPYKL